ncbi:MAG: hypothetical protein ABIZ04_22655 [Opitutus sp.]
MALVFVLHGVLNADEGFYLAASHLVSQGHRLYHDFGYTQGPVFPYANLPWLELFGHTLAGQRLAGLAWTLLTVVLGSLGLRRHHSWPAAVIYVLLLLGAPVWLAFAVKGKTYAFAALAVLGGIWSVQSARSWRLRWTIFILAAAAGTGARLPLAGFFLPAFIGLLALTPGWLARLTAAAGIVAVATAVVFAAAFPNLDNFLFWTAGFHRDSSFYIPVWTHFWDCLRFAPVLWIAVLVHGWTLRYRHELQSSRTIGIGLNQQRVVLVSLAIALLSNLSASTTYAEYIFPFIPGAAFVAAPVLAVWLSAHSRIVSGLVILAIVGAGWNYLPEFSPNVLVHAGQAEAFLRGSVPPGAVVAASMPEIPIGAGAQLPRWMAMGKFGVTEDFPPELASQRGMITPAALQAMLLDPATRALVCSPSYNWNFFWSLPSYRTLSTQARESIFTMIRRQYVVRFINEEYVVYLRRAENQTSGEP